MADYKAKEELFEELELDYATWQEDLLEGETKQNDFDKWRARVKAGLNPDVESGDA
jgi:hypothetical protein